MRESAFMIIKGTTTEIVDIFRALTLPIKKEPMFNPIRLVVEEGRAKTVMQARENSGFIKADVKINTEGTTKSDVTIDAKELLRYCQAFSAKDNLTIDCDEIITISNGKKTAEIYSRAENPKVPSRFVHIEGSTVVWDHWKGEPKPCTTFVDVQASELAGLLADYDIVKSDEEYKLHFSEDGSYGVVGSAETRSTSIKTDFVATTKGSPIDIRL